jgi:hypothetical protein
MARRLVVVLITVAAAVTAFPTGAEASHRKVLCGNFGGQFMDPHLARRPANCDVTAIGRNGTGVAKLRSMHWTRWGGHAKGRGLVNGRQRAVRLRRARPCGPDKVYSQMRIGSSGWHRILYCGD